MIVTPQLTFRGFTATETLSVPVQEHLEKLEKLFPRITSCHVVIALAHHRHHRHGERFTVRVELGVPGQQLVVNGPAEDDGKAAVNAAFEAMRRVLADYAQKARGEVKPRTPDVRP